MRIPRRELAGSIGLGGVLGAGVAATTAGLLGGGSGASIAAALVVVGGVVLTIWPILLMRRVALTTFAGSVLMMGVLRLMAMLGVGLVVDLTLGLPRMAFWMGVVGGATVVLLVETVALLVILKRLDRSPSADAMERVGVNLSTDGGSCG